MRVYPNITRATGTKVKWVIALMLIGFITAFIGLRQVALWNYEYKINYKPAKLEANFPSFFITERETMIPVIQMQFPIEVDTPLKEYICDKWGIMECKVAIAVFTAESGMNCLAWNANTNGTIDIGVAQINSTHFDEDFTLADATDCYKNVDKAYEIYLDSGWYPWVAFWNGAFQKHL